MLKNKSGITLIALIITIIVLLILAGITIGLVVGDNGILTKAKDASISSKIAQMKEAMQIAVNDVQTAYFGKVSIDPGTTFNGEVNYGTLGTALSNQGYQLLIKGGADDRKVATGSTGFPESNQTPASFYVSDGTNGIGVNINKSPGGTALELDYDETDGKIALSDAKPVGGTLSPKIASVVSVGDYVDIGVPYVDLANYKRYRRNGWRVLDVDTDAGVVKLISTAHPLTFEICGYDASQNLVELHKISTESLSARCVGKDYFLGWLEPKPAKYIDNGFSTNDVYLLFSNTSIFSNISIPVLNDLSGLNENSNLRATGFDYWLGEENTAYSDLALYYIKNNGEILSDSVGTKGVRPLVTLVPGLTIEGGEGTNASPYRINGFTDQLTDLDKLQEYFSKWEEVGEETCWDNENETFKNIEPIMDASTSIIMPDMTVPIIEYNNKYYFLDDHYPDIDIIDLNTFGIRITYMDSILVTPDTMDCLIHLDFEEGTYTDNNNNEFHGYRTSDDDGISRYYNAETGEFVFEEEL